MADVQIAVIDQQNTQIALAAPAEAQVAIAVPGVQGPVGEGVPSGGTTNQVLFKQSGTDYDTAWSEVTSAMIGDLEIVNADVAAGAEIAVSKLADGSARQLLQTDAAGTGVEWTSNVDVPGTLDVTGAATFDSSVAVTGALTKSGNNVVTVGDTGTVTSTMILDGTIVNSDINASAAIAGTKISPDFGSQTVQTTGIISHALGSAAAPTVTFTGDTNTGIYSPGADQVAISISGTGRLFVNSSGNVGIGTASPGSTCYIYDSTGATGVLNVDGTGAPSAVFRVGGVGRGIVGPGNGVVSGGSTNDFAVGATANLIFASNGTTERLRITSAGLVGIGTSAPQSLMQVGGYSGTNGITIGAGSSNYSYIYLADGTGGTEAYRGYLQYNHATDKLELGSAGLTALTIDSSQRVGIGTTSFGGKLTVKTTSSNGAPTAWSDGQFVVTAGDGTTAPGLSISTNTSDNSVSFSALTPGTGWNNLHYRAASHIFYRSDASSNEVARFDTSGRLLVGTSSARTDFYSGGSGVLALIEGTSFATASASITRNSNDNADGAFVFAKSRGTSNGGVALVNADDNLGEISWQGADGVDMVRAARIRAEVDGTPGANDMPGRLVFSTTADGASSPTERMRINSSGQVSINTPSATYDAAEKLTVEGSASIRRSGATVLHIGRNTDDGKLISFYQADTEEGDISVSGTTVSYNGAHLSRWSQLPGGATREEILRGTVLSNIDEMCGWGDEDNEQLNRMKVSDIEGDPNVSGVFQAWDDDDDTYVDDFYCAMTGDFIIRIAEGVTVTRGDLLMSAGDGTAKPQDDDIIRSKTIAKVTSTHVTCTYDDGSYCVPCVLMAC